MIADLDTVLIALYVELTDAIIPSLGLGRRGPGRPPVVTDAELVCLAVAQVLLRYDDERHWLRAAPHRVGHLFPRLLGQSEYTSGWLLPVALPLVLGAKLLLIVTCEGTVTGFGLANPKLLGERQQARQLLTDRPANRPAPATAVVTDKGLAGQDTEEFLLGPGLELTLIRPARKDETTPGTSRPSGWNTTSVAEQADDGATLLAVLGQAPAVLLGTSAGGSIALELALRHPEAVRAAIVHEPPLLAATTDPRQSSPPGALIQQGMAAGGPRAVMERFLRWAAGDAAFASIDPADRDRYLDNGEVFLGVEMPP